MKQDLKIQIEALSEQDENHPRSWSILRGNEIISFGKNISARAALEKAEAEIAYLELAFQKRNKYKTYHRLEDNLVVNNRKKVASVSYRRTSV